MKYISNNILAINKLKIQFILNIVKLKLKKLLDMPRNKVTISFIIKLPRLKNLIIKEVYNIILVIVNKLIKYFYIILFKKKYIVK